MTGQAYIQTGSGAALPRRIVAAFMELDMAADRDGDVSRLRQTADQKQKEDIEGFYFSWTGDGLEITNRKILRYVAPHPMLLF